MTNLKACFGDGIRSSGLKRRDPRVAAALDVNGLNPGKLAEASLLAPGKERADISGVSVPAFGSRGGLRLWSSSTGARAGAGRGAVRVPLTAGLASDGTCLTTRFLRHFRQKAAFLSGEKKVALQTEQALRNFIPLILVTLV